MRKLLQIIYNDLEDMSFKHHLIYWIVPLLILSLLMIFYFSGDPTLVELICPTENWEWGLLENIQLVIILCIFILAIYAYNVKDAKVLRWGFLLVAIFSLFVFLEEIDYGTHFAQLTSGEKREFLDKYIPSKNIHNRGNNAKLFKRSVYLLMALIFVLSPFMKSRIKHPLIKFLIPMPRIVIVAVLAIIIDLVPRIIIYYNIREDGGLGVNIGEFSEIIVYYIFLLYLIQLVFHNRLIIRTIPK